MEEQVVSLCVAKLAKEKNFNIPLVTRYLGEEGSIRDVYSKDLTVIKAEYPAPRQALLQKWLRDIHKIHIEIYNNHPYGWVWMLTNTNGELFADVPECQYFNSYEEALEDALSEGLKLVYIEEPKLVEN